MGTHFKVGLVRETVLDGSLPGSSVFGPVTRASQFGPIQTVRGSTQQAAFGPLENVRIPSSDECLRQREAKLREIQSLLDGVHPLPCPVLDIQPYRQQHGNSCLLACAMAVSRALNVPAASLPEQQLYEELHREGLIDPEGLDTVGPGRERVGQFLLTRLGLKTESFGGDVDVFPARLVQAIEQGKPVFLAADRHWTIICGAQCGPSGIVWNVMNPLNGEGLQSLRSEELARKLLGDYSTGNLRGVIPYIYVVEPRRHISFPPAR